MSRKRFRCFVAMAIGRKATDYIYENCIELSIRSAGLSPFRVDKITHNDRIDDRIRKEIEKADVVIADLTYARPSVYWEAGFAERSIPVVYTCRGDHFRQKENDEFGNFIIHFDLQNANIIPWYKTGSKRFINELRRRLLFVTKTARKQRDFEYKIANERAKFSENSRSEQQKIITEKTIFKMRRSGYRKLVAKYTKRTILVKNSLYEDYTTIYWKKLGNTALIVVPYQCHLNLSKKKLEWLHFAPIFDYKRFDEFIDWQDLPNLIIRYSRRSIRNIRQLKIVPVLSSLTENKIRDVFTSWRIYNQSIVYYRPTLYRPRFSIKDPQVLLPSSSEILFFDNIKSLYEFDKSLTENLNLIESLKDTIIAPVDVSQ